MSLLDRLTQGAAARPASGTLREFLEAEVAADKGPFTLAGRAALAEPIERIERIIRERIPDQTVSILKGTQIGFSTLAVGLALYCVIVERLNAGYFLPDDDFAARFDDTRIRATLRSGKLQAAMRDGDFKGVKAKGLKEFPGADGSRFLYVLGLHDIGNATSVPLDMGLYDEADDIKPDNMQWSRDRYDASDFAFTLNLGMGRTPGAGIHAHYLGGSQRVWRVPCPGCGAEWALEENWPDIVREEEGPAPRGGPRGGPERKAFLACPACAHPLDREAGRWVPTDPGAEERGHASYRVPQLAVSAIRLDRILAKWRAARTPREQAMFRCSCLALPDAGDMQPITDDLLRRLREAEPYHMEVVA